MTTNFTQGQVVKVLQRQWPGVNKEGGIARVTKVNPDSTLAVEYVIGNDRESSVHVKVGGSAYRSGVGVLHPSFSTHDLFGDAVVVYPLASHTSLFLPGNTLFVTAVLRKIA